MVLVSLGRKSGMLGLSVHQWPLIYSPNTLLLVEVTRYSKLDLAYKKTYLPPRERGIASPLALRLDDDVLTFVRDFLPSVVACRIYL